MTRIDTYAWLVLDGVYQTSADEGAPVFTDATAPSNEQLTRYSTRPAIANVSINREGNAVLKLKTPWRNSATHIILTPIEFMQRLVALVPRPRLHLIRFHGVLAPSAKLRPKVVPVLTN